MWLIELLTKWWELPFQFRRLNSFITRRPLHSPARVLIAANSIGLDRDGTPTVANREVVATAVKMFKYPFSSPNQYDPLRELIFCTGKNQPVPSSSADAMLKYALGYEYVWLVAKYPEKIADTEKKRIVLDNDSVDTPGNANAAMNYLLRTSTIGSFVGVGVVAHPLHMRRSLLCMRQAIRKHRKILGIQHMTVRAYALPALYAYNDETRQRIYEKTPGQPWLNSHALFLFYEMAAYLYCWLFPNRSKKKRAG